AMAGQVTVVTAERIAEELRKLLVDPQRARGVALLDELGLLPHIFLQDLLPMKGLPQGLPPSDAPALPPPGRPGPLRRESAPGATPNDLWHHVLRVLDLLGPEPSFPLAFAALLHDVGKPRTVGRTPERYTFHYHEHVGRRLASDICLRLKLSNEERERIEWLVEKHQFLCDAPRMRTRQLKQTLVHPGVRDPPAPHRADAP